MKGMKAMQEKSLGIWMYMIIQAILLLTVLILAIYWIIYHPSFWMKALGAIYITMVIFLMTDRDTFLPFLGEAVFPKSLLEQKTPTGADTTVQLPLSMPDGTLVVYWAAEPSNKSPVEDPWKAYQGYSNAGVATVAQGTATLSVRKPSAYAIPSGRTLKPHIHYRIMLDNGMLSNVRTLYF
jgi:hypothetical protein